MNRVMVMLIASVIISAVGGIIAKPPLIGMFFFFCIAIMSIAVRDVLNHFFGDDWL